MYASLGLAIACLAVAVHGIPTTEVVGGKDAPAGKYPYQVSIQFRGKHSCGGSIVNKNTILTAAHCIVNKEADSITVLAGTNLLNEGGTVYNAKELVIHNDYRSLRLIHDIGLVILSTEIEYTKLIQPIRLSTSDVSAGQRCVLTGWGRLSRGGIIPNSLQEVDMLVYDHAKCRRRNWMVKASHVCAFTQRGQGACNGDSGGPLVADGVQIGIVSFGVPCAVGAPDVYTRVFFYKQWLQEYVPDLK